MSGCRSVSEVGSRRFFRWPPWRPAARRSVPRVGAGPASRGSDGVGGLGRYVCAIAIASIAAGSGTALRAQGTVGAFTLVVAGDVRAPQSLSTDTLKSLPRRSVEIVESGRTLVYQGVLVSDVLKRAGASMGAQLRGEAIVSFVVATASDGNRAVFSIAELDPDLTGSQILVADTLAGQPLPSTQGPLRIVVPRDTTPVRSVRMLQRLDVVRLPRPAGGP